MYIFLFVFLILGIGNLFKLKIVFEKKKVFVIVDCVELLE